MRITTKTIPTALAGSETSLPRGTSHQEKLTSAASSTCKPTTSKVSGNAISSRGLVAGLTPSDSPVGPTTDLFGQAVAHVSRSQWQVSEKETTTNATYGRIGPISLASASLQQCLENKLRGRMDLNGSTECLLTWKHKILQSGRRLFQLAASVRLTNAIGPGLWPTPTARDGS